MRDIRNPHLLQRVKQSSKYILCQPRANFLHRHLPRSSSHSLTARGSIMSMSHASVSAGMFDTSHTAAVRKYNRTYGLIPPAVDTLDNQLARCLKRLARKSTPIDKYMYLSRLRNSDVHLFYRLVTQQIKDIAPLIYTPTVGDAWSQNYVQPEGLYLTYADRGRIRAVLNNWPQHNAEMFVVRRPSDLTLRTVVTDGSRILGLGDLGVNGMGIPVGKLNLYIAAGGIRPEVTLPLTLDFGTNNQDLIDDPLYMGTRRARVSEEDALAFMGELLRALNEKWPGIVVQFEDFKNPFPALEKFGPTHTCFNDDIQGTGAVILGGIINAVKQSGIAAKDHRAVFLGAGSAGVGVAKQIVEFFIREGLTEDQARRCFYLVDSKGLVTLNRGDKLAEHKVYFARDDNNDQQYRTLEEVVEHVKPSILMGLSTIGGAFTPTILKKVASWHKRPIIFPLSNPSSQSECNFEDAVKYTDGRALFASGSPFDPVKHDGATLVPGQGNNMYVFPGIGLGTILSKATVVTQSMIYASALALSTSLTETEKGQDWLYPDIARIRDVSVIVAMGVIRAADQAGVARETHVQSMTDEDLEKWVRSKMYDPYDETAILESQVRDLFKE